MSLNYITFKENIEFFDYDNYLNSKEHEFINTYNKFYKFYINLIKDEIEKTKQLNAKFSKNINEKNNKYNNKYNRVNYNIEFKKVYSFENINDENEKLNIIIRTYLNKITNDTYERVTEQLINKLLENKNINIFKILSKEIINKCIFDYKYRNLYINFCSKVWNNKKIHLNLVEIEKINDKYYGKYNLNDIESDKIGPFDSIDKLKDYIFKKINFKNFFVDFLQELYNNKELNLENLDDQNFFDEKKKTLLLVELLSILFIERHINFDIINLIIIDLLHQNNNFNMIKEIEFELLHVMMSFIYKNNKSFKFIEYKKIIENFKNILNSIINTDMIQISKRSKYFINEIINIFSNIINNVKYIENNDKDKDKDNNLDKLFENALKANLNTFKYNFKIINENQKNEIILKIINKILENNDSNLIKSFHSIYNNHSNFIENTLSNIINNIDDIILDIPNIDKNIIKFINEFNLNNKLLIYLHEKMDSLNSDDNSDDNSDEDFNNEKISFRN